MSHKTATLLSPRPAAHQADGSREHLSKSAPGLDFSAAREHADAARHHASCATQHAVLCGLELLRLHSLHEIQVGKPKLCHSGIIGEKRVGWDEIVEQETGLVRRTSYRWMALAKQAAPALLDRMSVTDYEEAEVKIVEVAADVDLQPELYRVIERESQGKSQADFLAALFAGNGEVSFPDLKELLKDRTIGEKRIINTLWKAAHGETEGLVDADKHPQKFDDGDDGIARKFLEKIANGMEPGRAWAGMQGKLHSATRSKTDHLKNWRKGCTSLAHSAAHVGRMSTAHQAEAVMLLGSVLELLPQNMRHDLARTLD